MQDSLDQYELYNLSLFFDKCGNCADLLLKYNGLVHVNVNQCTCEDKMLFVS